MQHAISIVFVVLAAVVFSTNAELNCKHEKIDIPKEWIDLNPVCMNAVKQHVKEEIQASIQYLAMAAHFSRDTVNKPGFAKMFFKAADEERAHAIEFIGYLLWRGELATNISTLIDNINMTPPVTQWKTGLKAMKSALELESKVTNMIKEVVRICDDTPDENNAAGPKKPYEHYHIVDYLTAEFLQEQKQGEQELANKISKLAKMSKGDAQLAEWMFDKELSE